MPNSTKPRAFGSETSGNSGRNCELSKETRQAIYHAVRAGEPKAKIAKDFGVNRSTVYETFNRVQRAETFHSSPRSGRPPVLSDRDKRHILRLVRQEPTIGWKTLASEVPGGASKSTIKRTLRECKKTKIGAKEAGEAYKGINSKKD